MEPLIRNANVVSAGLSAGAYMLGFHKLSLFMLVLNGLDMVGRQVSPDYRRLATLSRQPLAGLGFVSAVRSFQWR